MTEFFVDALQTFEAQTIKYLPLATHNPQIQLIVPPFTFPISTSEVTNVLRLRSDTGEEARQTIIDSIDRNIRPFRSTYWTLDLRLNN